MAENNKDESSNTQSVKSRVQKKMASKLLKKEVVKKFVDDTTKELLDHLEKLAKKEYATEKKAKKLVKYIAIIIGKIGIHQRGEDFNDQESEMIKQFKVDLKDVMMMAISFQKGDLAFDRGGLVSKVKKLEEMLLEIVKRHLHDKSHKRIRFIFAFFESEDLLDKLFLSDGRYKVEMKSIAELLENLV